MSASLARSVSLAVLCLLPLAGCGGRRAEESETSNTVPVSVQPARRGPIRSVVDVTGVVRPAPGGEQIVVAPQSARILEIPHAAGERVRKGDLLVRFEIPSLEAETSGRESDLRRAEARLENADAALTRVSGLLERGIAARKEVEDAKRERAEADAAVAESKSATAAASLLAQRETVRAMFHGVIAARTHNPGDLVDASSAEPILRVIDPGRLQVEASVPVDALPWLAAGSPARVFGPSNYAPEEARVRSLPVAVDPSTATATVRLDFAKPPHLPAGTPVRVEIVGQEHRDALLVPSAALLREKEESFVYTVDASDKAHRRKVEVGLVADLDAEILSGIDAGERVVVEGQSALPDGAVVSIRP